MTRGFLAAVLLTAPAVFAANPPAPAPPSTVTITASVDADRRWFG